VTRLVLRNCDWMDDWYVIERAEHDGRSWMEPMGDNCFAYQCSSRISDADVEGSGAEMLAIATAIESRGNERFKRCAVSFESDGVHFCSPRNSQRDGVVSAEDADDLARQIRAALGAKCG
jgi:hypothetical protein